MVTITVRCRNPVARRGFSDVGVDVLAEMPAKQRDDWLTVLNQAATRYRSPTQVSSIVQVVRLWATLRIANPTLFPFAPLGELETIRVLKRLRRAVYERMATCETRLGSANGLWASFLRAAEMVAKRGGLPPIDFASPALASFPNIQTTSARERAATGESFFENEAPASFRAEDDNFNDDLLVPISIVLSDQLYLEEYERRLGDALTAFENAAEIEFRHLVRRRALGMAFQQRLPYAELRERFTIEVWN